MSVDRGAVLPITSPARRGAARRLAVVATALASSVFVAFIARAEIASAEDARVEREAGRGAEDDADIPIFGLALSVATTRGAPVRDDAWIAAQIADANVLFAGARVQFRWTRRAEIGEAHAAMRSRADRDALAPLVSSRVIDVFVVASLEDVDEPGRMRKGVAWTSRPSGRRYLILSAEAPPRVLAHELGHYFGNPHSPVPDNLMSYERTGGPVALDDAQRARTRAKAAGFLATGRLVDVGPPRFLY